MMRTRLTLSLLCLLVPMLASGCSTSTPTMLIITYYDYGKTQLWTITNASLVEQLYTQALALPQVAL